MTLKDTQSGAGAGRLAACTQAVSTFLDVQLEALHEGARQPLLVAARDAGEHDEEERLLAVMEEVDALCPLATGAFRDAVLEKLRAPDGEPATASEGDDDDGLDLVETAKLDDWVRLRRLLGRHSAEAQAIERHVWERLTAITGGSSHPDDCPVNLAGVCVLFQGAMHNLGAGRAARAAIYDAFEVSVVAHLASLIANLDMLLDDSSLDAAPLESPDALPDAPAGAHEGAVAATGDTVDPARLLGVLAGVQRHSDTAVGEEAIDAKDFEAQLAAAVAPPGVDLDADEKRTLAVVARLVHQVVEHPDVDEGLKRRLRRLAPPLLTLALQGDDYLEAELDSARHDPVTGLLDRAALRSRLELLLHHCAGGDTGPTVCLVDADEIAAITDRLGHQVGGRLLRALGELLRKHAGTAAFVARIRGNEFAVVLPAARAGAGRRFAKHVLAALAKARFVFGGEQVSLAVSIGVVEFDDSLDTPAALMQAADAARQAAKAAGGGCLHMHDAEAQLA
jgi:diguanylate cyclase (GGDEF)-like protein